MSFKVKGERGAKVLVEHSEVLDKDGNFYNQNLRSAEARLEYVLKGEGVESYRPHFTFQGFRFARVTITGKAELRFDRVDPDHFRAEARRNDHDRQSRW